VFIVESHDLLAERPWSRSVGIGGRGDVQFLWGYAPDAIRRSLLQRANEGIPRKNRRL
jgi:hypothetical protein